MRFSCCWDRLLWDKTVDQHVIILNERHSPAWAEQTPIVHHYCPCVPVLLSTLVGPSLSASVSLSVIAPLFSVQSLTVPWCLPDCVVLCHSQRPGLNTLTISASSLITSTSRESWILKNNTITLNEAREALIGYNINRKVCFQRKIKMLLRISLRIHIQGLGSHYHRIQEERRQTIYRGPSNLNLNIKEKHWMNETKISQEDFIEMSMTSKFSEREKPK